MDLIKMDQTQVCFTCIHKLLFEKLMSNLISLFFTQTTCDDSVGIVTTLRAALIEIQHPAGARYFPFVQNAQIGTGVHPNSR